MTTAPDPSPNLGARLGTLIGFTAWAVMLGFLVAAEGEPLLALELAAIGVASGLGLGQLCLLAVEACDRGGASKARRARVLWGGFLVSIGILMLVWGIGMMPLLANHPHVIECLGRVGGTAILPGWVCGLLIAVGAVLLAVRGSDATVQKSDSPAA